MSWVFNSDSLASLERHHGYDGRYDVTDDKLRSDIRGVVGRLPSSMARDYLRIPGEGPLAGSLSSVRRGEAALSRDRHAPYCNIAQHGSGESYHYHRHLHAVDEGLSKPHTAPPPPPIFRPGGFRPPVGAVGPVFAGLPPHTRTALGIARTGPNSIVTSQNMDLGPPCMIDELQWTLQTLLPALRRSQSQTRSPPREGAEPMVADEEPQSGLIRALRDLLVEVSEGRELHQREPQGRAGEYDSLRETIDTLQKKLQQSELANERLGQQHAALQQRYEELRLTAMRDMEAREAHEAHCKQELRDLHEELRLSRISTQCDQCGVLEDEISSLRDDLDHAHSALRDKDEAHERECQGHDKLLAEYRESITNLRSKVRAMSGKVESPNLVALPDESASRSISRTVTHKTGAEARALMADACHDSD